eukprot:Clim_evm4s234 gene=Clim_evmTU4s234
MDGNSGRYFAPRWDHNSHGSGLGSRQSASGYVPPRQPEPHSRAAGLKSNGTNYVPAPPTNWSGGRSLAHARNSQPSMDDKNFPSLATNGSRGGTRPGVSWGRQENGTKRVTGHQSVVGGMSRSGHGFHNMPPRRSAPSLPTQSSSVNNLVPKFATAKISPDGKQAGATSPRRDDTNGDAISNKDRIGQLLGSSSVKQSSGQPIDIPKQSENGSQNGTPQRSEAIVHKNPLLNDDLLNPPGGMNMSRSLEAEERFMKNLGWTPSEEANLEIPEEEKQKFANSRDVLAKLAEKRGMTSPPTSHRSNHGELDLSSSEDETDEEE